MQKYAGLYGRESLRTLSLRKLRAILLTGFPPAKLGDSSGSILDLRNYDCNIKLVSEARGTVKDQKPQDYFSR
jgi:hypothetical protein